MNSFSGRPIYPKELDSRSKQGPSTSGVITMELTPDHLAHTIYKANRVWQMEGQCETFSGGNRVISLDSETSDAQVVHLASHFVKIGLSEINNGVDLNSEGFSSSLVLFHVLLPDHRDEQGLSGIS